MCLVHTGSSGRFLTNLVLLLLRCPQHVKKISLYSLVVVSLLICIWKSLICLFTLVNGWQMYKPKILTEHKLGF
jgi:hypothetical protein